MKTGRRWLFILLTLVLSFGAVAGCANKKVDSSDKPMDETETNALPMVDGKYNPPVTITYLRPWDTDVTFKNGESPENNVHTKWAEERLGIKLKPLWTAGNNGNNTFDTKLRLALSSNEKMPDLISCRCDYNLIRELIDSGQYIDGGALFDQYASKVWKDAMAETPTAWYPWMKDGKRIGIPILDYAYNNDPVVWVREDWKKKLNLPDPNTLDDLEKMMDAFTNMDPDGNNKNDTYGLTVGFKNYLNTWMADAGWIFGAFGAMPNQWNKTADGTLEYGSINPGVKSGLEVLKNWMDKGYVSQESALWDESKASELFSAGKAGIIVGPYWMPAWPLGDLTTNVPGSEFKAYPIPAGPDGKVGRHGSSVGNGVVLINKNWKNPEVFFTYQNYLYDHYANPKAGSEFENGTAEGYDWAMVDGKPTTDGDKIPGGSAAAYKYFLTFEGARIPSLNMNTIAKLASGAEPETPFEKNIKKNSNEQGENSARVLVSQKDIAMYNMFTGAPTQTMQDKSDILSKLEKDMFVQILYNKLPLDAFDDFVKKWKSSGGDEINKEVNDWYKSVTSK